MEGFRFEEDDLSRHAREVDALTARLRTAGGAGTPLDLGAYGVIGRVFAVAVVDAAGEASRSVGRLADGSRALGDGVRAAVHEYLEAERRAAAPLRGIDP
ncbi:hypothetical protein [Pseudonocardia zijingensis]|jgi:hypothetical protein|uniref:Excreted virulence factor EspC (Type VII ESX diderm) n=1 Tax=Pseudonocardia zijingensis TaxID=153376 RepID=A0ABP3ZEJ0_9PSEU